MKKRLAVALIAAICALCAVCGLAGCSLFGGNDKKGIVNYKLSDDGSYAIVESIDFPWEDSDKYLTIASTYKNKPVKVIGERASANARGGLIKVTLPSSVTTIENYAFYECSALESVDFGNNSKLETIGNYAFAGCNSLPNVSLPNGVSEIGEGAFSNCSSLKSIKIPDGITALKAGTFSGCTSFTEVTVPDSVVEIGEGLFNGCNAVKSITLPFIGTSLQDTRLTNLKYFVDCTAMQNVTVKGGIIGGGAFYEASKTLEKVTLGEGVTEIGGGAFSGCKKLSCVTVPSSVTSIGDNAFAGTNITEIELPEGLTKISDGMFYGSALTKLKVPASVTAIGVNAFSRCLNLEELTYAEDSALERIDSNAFNMANRTSSYNEVFESDQEPKLRTITIPEGVKTIGAGAFWGCSAVRYINWNAVNCNVILNFGNPFVEYDSYNRIENCAGCNDGVIVNFGVKVQKIPDKAFMNFKSLISVNFGGGIGTSNTVCESIGDSAFYNCERLYDMSMPVNLKTVGTYAFYKCYSLIKIYIPSTVTTIGRNAFAECVKLIEVCNDSTCKGDFGFAKNIYSSSSGSSNLFSYGMDGKDVYTFYRDGSKYYLMGAEDNTSHGLILPSFVFRGNSVVSETYEIYGSAFLYRTDEYVMLSKPEAITEIGNGAFNTGKLKGVIFYGNQADWNKLPTYIKEAFSKIPVIYR